MRQVRLRASETEAMDFSRVRAPTRLVPRRRGPSRRRPLCQLGNEGTPYHRPARSRAHVRHSPPDSLFAGYLAIAAGRETADGLDGPRNDPAFEMALGKARRRPSGQQDVRVAPGERARPPRRSLSTPASAPRPRPRTRSPSRRKARNATPIAATWSGSFGNAGLFLVC